jgi:membrane associated rhomboid family serine protease
MIPLRDDTPSRRFPVVMVSFIVINVLVFLYQQYLAGVGQLDARPVPKLHQYSSHVIPQPPD